MALKNLQGNSFGLMPENFLLSLVMPDKDQRRVELDKIITLRQNPHFTRNKQTPKINFSADEWCKLIDIDINDVTEPPLTRQFSKWELKRYHSRDKKLPLPKLPSHSQSVERCVKLVTWDSKNIYGIETRHWFINATVLSRMARPAFDTKAKYVSRYSAMFETLKEEEVEEVEEDKEED